jgi:hypothetical protein
VAHIEISKTNGPTLRKMVLPPRPSHRPWVIA